MNGDGSVPGGEGVTKAAEHLEHDDRDYEKLSCPICGKVFGELCVEGRAVYKKDPCPRCKNVVFIEKNLTNRDGGRKLPKTKGARA